MNKIEQLLQQYCPDGVEYLKLSQVIKLEKGKQLNKELLTDFGDYPAYNGGLSYSGFTDKFNYEENKIIISQGGASAGFVNYVTTKFYANAHCYVVLPNVEIVLNRYVFHFLKLNQENLTSKQHGAGIPALKTSEILQIPIPIPPLPIQEEIVNILDKFTALEAELEAELEARSRQYEYYRNQLLAFEGKEELEWISIGEVCLKTNNIKWKDNIGVEYQYIDLSAVNRENNKIDIEELQTITSENAPSRAQQIVNTNDILFGTTRPTLKRYTIIGENLNNQICSTGFCVLRPNTDLILPKYLFFLLKSNSFYLYVENNQEGAGYPSISNSKVKNFTFPLPSLEEQERIVNILDQFDALVNDIKTGLPAEITARRAQYEYYRKKLLTFQKT